jgi:preprotein translocase subunit SecG
MMATLSWTLMLIVCLSVVVFVVISETESQKMSAATGEEKEEAMKETRKGA